MEKLTGKYKKVGGTSSLSSSSVSMIGGVIRQGGC